MKYLIYIIAFVEGAILLGLQITVPKIIAPFFGLSLSSWTLSISLSLLGIAVGYMIASYALLKAKRVTSIVQFDILFVAGWLMLLLYAKTELLDFALSTMGEYGLLFSFVLYILIPSLVLGNISPILVHLLTLKEYGAVRNAQVKVYTLSTLGSFFGTPIIFIQMYRSGIIESLLWPTILFAICGIALFLAKKSRDEG